MEEKFNLVLELFYIPKGSSICGHCSLSGICSILKFHGEQLSCFQFEGKGYKFKLNSKECER